LARGKRQEARGKRQEARGKRQEARGKKQEARGKRASVTLISIYQHYANAKKLNSAVSYLHAFKAMKRYFY
jgi:hypothetical protein